MSNTELISEFDFNGNMIHYRNTDGFEYWWERDTNGSLIYYKDITGREWWYWEGKRTLDPIKILLLSTQLYSEVSQ